MPASPATEAMLTIAPRPRSSMMRSAARVHAKVPKRWTSSMRRHSASSMRLVTPSERRAPPMIAWKACSVCARSRGESSPMPALLARMSTVPHSRTTRAKSASTCALSATSVGTPMAVPPSARISAATRSALSRFRSATATCAPSAAKRRAIARPIPDPPPVTTATRLVSRAMRRLSTIHRRESPRPGGGPSLPFRCSGQHAEGSPRSSPRRRRRRRPPRAAPCARSGRRRPSSRPRGRSRRPARRTSPTRSSVWSTPSRRSERSRRARRSSALPGWDAGTPNFSTFWTRESRTAAEAVRHALRRPISRQTYLVLPGRFPTGGLRPSLTCWRTSPRKPQTSSQTPMQPLVLAPQRPRKTLDSGAQQGASSRRGVARIPRGRATKCGDTGETSHVNPKQPTIATTASGPVTIGQAIHDTAQMAELVSGVAPTGTITFTAYAPNANGSVDATCGTAVFTDIETVDSTGKATSGNFTPSGTAPQIAGTYEWKASYSGDANYKGVTSSCNDTGEQSLVNKKDTTTPTGQKVVISDFAKPTGFGTPTGTVTFSLFDNASCTGTPIFTQTPSLVNGLAHADDPTPLSANGTYKWVVTYNGDANNSPSTSACGTEFTTLGGNVPGVDP